MMTLIERTVTIVRMTTMVCRALKRYLCRRVSCLLTVTKWKSLLRDIRVPVPKRCLTYRSLRLWKTRSWSGPIAVSKANRPFSSKRWGRSSSLILRSCSYQRAKPYRSLTRFLSPRTLWSWKASRRARVLALRSRLKMGKIWISKPWWSVRWAQQT